MLGQDLGHSKHQVLFAAQPRTTLMCWATKVVQPVLMCLTLSESFYAATLGWNTVR